MGARSFEEVVYPGLWEGISLRYHFEGGKLKYEFVVLPGADPSVIRLKYEGADRLVIDENTGDLVVSAGPTSFTDDAPAANQTGSCHEMEVWCEYLLSDGSMVRFDVGDYDTGNTLIIDPGVVFSTYLGGTDGEVVNDIWVDEEEGYCLIAGTTQGGGFPDTPAGFQYGDRTTEWHYLVRMDQNASRIEYVVLLTLTRMNMITDIFVDDDASVYLTGYSEDGNFPTTIGAFMQSRPGARDAFLMKLDPTGTEVIFSTMFGGNLLDSGLALRVDANGCAYVVGSTNSTDLPVTGDAYMSTHQGDFDAFVVKFNVNGSDILYSTYLGGSSHDYANNLEIDGDDTLYIAGLTRSSDLPLTPMALRYQNNGLSDVFLAQLDTSGGGLEYMTYIGGDHDDTHVDMAIDVKGDLYLVGNTRSDDFPTTEGAIDRGSRSNDVFALKVTTDNWSMAYSTFLGGSGGDSVHAVSVDPSGRACVIGDTISRDLPTTSDAHCSTYNDDGDILLMILDPEGTSLVYSTYLGGDGRDSGTACQYTTDGVIFAAGATNSQTYPTTEGAFCETHSGGGDVFFTSFDILPPLAYAGDDRTVGISERFTLDASGSSDNLGIVDWHWTLHDGGETVDLYGEIVEFAFDSLGVFSVNLSVTDVVGHVASDGLIIRVVDTTPPVANGGNDIVIDQHQEVIFDASESTDNVGIVNWSWMVRIADKWKSMYGPQPVLSFPHVGEFTCTLTVRDEAGNTDQDDLIVKVRDSEPPSTRGYGDDVYTDQFHPTELNGTRASDNVGVVNWTWVIYYDGQEVTLSGETAVFTFDIPGNFSIQLSVSDAEGNQDSIFFTVNVRDAVPPVADIKGPKKTEIGRKVVFNAYGSTDNTAIVKWTWRFKYEDHDERFRGPEFEFTFDVPGRHEIILHVVDTGGNVNHTSHIIVVEDNSLSQDDLMLILLIVSAMAAVSISIIILRSARNSEK